MNEQTITVNNIALTHAQVQEAYDKMQKVKAENEIKVGDYVLSSDFIIMKVETIKDDCAKGCRGFLASVSSAKKLHLTPEKKAWLDSLIGGVE